MINSTVEFQDLGLIDYKECWDYQTKLFNQTVQQKIHNRKNPKNKTVTRTAEAKIFIDLSLKVYLIRIRLFL